MPHLSDRTAGHRLSRTALIMAAVGLALSATVTACSSTVTSTPPRADAASVVHLKGAGSTFDAPFFSLAFAAYQRAHPGTAISYASVGSSAGITRFTGGQTDFGATDVPATSTDLDGAQGGPTLQIPVDLGAVSVAYNVLTRNGAPLKLTGPVLARIFLGQITKWNDPALTALNPGADLPDAYITVVHRSDGSGTTYIFSNYLSAVSPAWATTAGTGRSLHWPVGYGRNGNPGVADAVARIAYSIGYVERSYTTGTSLGSAAIQNQAGEYVTPTNQSIAADAAAKPAITADDFSIVNQPGQGAYPICGYSWVLASASQQNQPAGQALISLLSWLIHDGQSYAATLGYVPLPAAIQQLADSTLARITGPGGTPLSS